MESTRQVFKIEMLFYQSKANLGEKILYGKVTHGLDPEIRKMLARGMFGNKESSFPNSILVHNLRTIETEILFLKLTV